jgi:transposase
LSSYAEGIDYVEWGYNRDGESLPQINFGVIYAEQVQLPLYYQLYPGSIPDVTTLKNIVNYLELFQLKEALVPFNSKRMGWRRYLPRISPAL